ncbi:MAG: DUF3109 family protein [Prevotella sp.]|nr:DUF3109 family protein [Prevotella sp.]
MILDIDNILVSSDVLTEHFACDLEKCHGRCCIEGDAGAPVTIDEIEYIENNLDQVWPLLSAQAQSVIDKQGVAYTDQEGDLVTSIVGGKDCVFTCYDDIKLSLPSENSESPDSLESSGNPGISGKSGKSGTLGTSGNSASSDSIVKNCCLCAYEKLYRQNKIQWCKPISCALYPIRVKTLRGGITALNYHRWDVCRDAVERGKREGIKVYQFLREPLIRRFGAEWYEQLCVAADEMGNL